MANWHKEFIKRCLQADETINDAAAYGVTIQPAGAEPGQPYYKVLGVKHLTPAENGGNHHAYVEVLDESGQRLFGCQLLVVNNNIRSFITIDKPIDEPGGNAPMSWGDTLDIRAIGFVNAELPGDIVRGLHTRHPDESDLRNSLGHHSFYLVAQRVIAGGVEPEPEPANLGRFIVWKHFTGEGWAPIYHGPDLKRANNIYEAERARGVRWVTLDCRLTGE